MRIVLDASVAIAAQRPTEPAYAASRAQLVRFLTGADTVLVPSFFIVEVSGALARLGFDPKAIARIVDRLTASPHEVVTVGPRGARAARARGTRDRHPRQAARAGRALRVARPSRGGAHLHARPGDPRAGRSLLPGRAPVNEHALAGGALEAIGTPR